jgi:hypothetical protein
MKRYRVFQVDLDTRAAFLAMEIGEHWQEDVKALHRENRETIQASVLNEYGTTDPTRTLTDFVDVGPLPLSVVAFHNKFQRQARTAFVAGGYYPALTGICALGERVLNHLVRGLRDSYRATPQYKKVYRHDSFDDWDLAIDTLVAWDVLLPAVAAHFRELKKARHQSIHFRPDTDSDDRALALSALRRFADIVRDQFSAFGNQPWFIPGVPGVSFLKKDWETRPFIRLVYLPNCAYVGPYHQVAHENDGWRPIDEHPYEEREVSDEEFARLFTGKPREAS